jgi:hypothetical protein
MVGSYEADDSRLTGRVARAPRPRPTEHLPVVDVAPEEEDETSPGDTSAVDPPVAPAEPEIETVTKLMGFLRDAGD